MSSWHSYPQVFNLGHRALDRLFSDPVTIQEKIDGSQISFGIFEGELRVRSKGQIFPIDAPPKMFSLAAEAILARSHLLRDGWTYRGEYLSKPKHNTLNYSRVPKDYIILYDISTGEETYALAATVEAEAERLELEATPGAWIESCAEMTVERFGEILEKGFVGTGESVLGGTKIEGVVIKNYSQFGPDKKVLMGKYVSEKFKEVHQGEWKKNNPGQSDIILGLIGQYKTTARWQKAVQHLREQGLIEDAPRDIGKLIKEIQADTFNECQEEIADALLKWGLPQIERGIVRGAAEWYKDELLARQFNGKEI